MAAHASTICPKSGSTGGFGTDTFVNVPGPSDGTCGPNSAIEMSIATNTDYARMEWLTPGTTLGTFAGVNASVSFTSALPSDQPYYMLEFTDPTQSVGQANSADQILMLEFQSSTVSGTDMALDPNSTLFNLYDNVAGTYLEGGQQNAHSLAYWLALDPSLGGDALTGFRIGEGLSGGCNLPGGCSETLTINSLDVPGAVTPEPSSVVMVSTGALCMGYAFFIQRRRQLTLV